MVPDTIVLDMDRTLGAVRKIACCDEANESYTDELIEGVIDCLSDKRTAYSCLMTYADAQRYANADWLPRAEADSLARAVNQFGLDLLEKFEHFGVYRNNQLEHTYSGRCEIRTLIMSRIAACSELDRRS